MQCKNRKKYELLKKIHFNASFIPYNFLVFDLNNDTTALKIISPKRAFQAYQNSLYIFLVKYIDS